MKGFVHEHVSGLNFAFLLYGKFLDICPDEVWQEKFGGWAVGRQLYHGLSAGAHFLGSLGGAGAVADPCPACGDLSLADGPVPTRADTQALMRDIQAAVEKLAGELDDAQLLAKNEAASRMLGRETSNGAVLGLMASHMLYHLGACDAALRQRGLQGAF